MGAIHSHISPFFISFFHFLIFYFVSCYVPILMSTINWLPPDGDSVEGLGYYLYVFRWCIWCWGTEVKFINKLLDLVSGHTCFLGHINNSTCSFSHCISYRNCDIAYTVWN